MGLSLLKIFKQAFIFTKTKRFLWSLGLFLIWGNLLMYWMIAFLQQLRASYQGEQQSATVPIGFNPEPTVLMGVVMLAVLALMFVGYVYSRTALALTVKDLIDHRPVDYRTKFRSSKQFIARQTASWALHYGSLFFCFALVILPVSYLWSEDFTYRAGILALIGVIILLPILFFTVVLNIFSGLFISLLNMNLKQSIKASFDIMAKFWWSLVNIFLTMLCLSFLCMLIGLFVQVLILIPFVILSGLPYDMVGLHWNSPLIIAGIVLGFLALLVFTAAVSVFQHISWTLIFLDLVKPKKTEEISEPEVIPEVV